MFVSSDKEREREGEREGKNKKLSSTISYKIFETNCSFHVK